MDLVALESELTNDPLARGYSGMADEAAAISLNAINRTVNRKVVPTYEVHANIVPAEYTALTTDVKANVNVLLSLGNILVNAANTQTVLLGAFGPATQTRANLILLAKEPASRAVELGLGSVTPSDVANARRLS